MAGGEAPANAAAADAAVAPAPATGGGGSGAVATTTGRRRERLQSLDALRGIAITVMVFVNAGGAPAWHTDHAEWDSRDAPLLHLADYACPIFVYCIGNSMGFGFARRAARRAAALRHAARRWALLVIIGMWIKNESIRGFGLGFDLSALRLPSVLGRLGTSYLVVAVLLIFVPRRECGRSVVGRAVPEAAELGWVWLAIAAVALVWLCIVFLLPVPGCPTGYLGPGGNDDGGRHENCTGGATGYIDVQVLGKRHMYPPGGNYFSCRAKYGCTGFDGLNLLGTLPSVVHVFLGFQASRALLRHDSPARRQLHLLCWGCGLAVLGITLDLSGALPLSKNLWSLSYVLWTSGLATLGLLCLYRVCDMPGAPPAAAAVADGGGGEEQGACGSGDSAALLPQPTLQDPPSPRAAQAASARDELPQAGAHAACRMGGGGRACGACVVNVFRAAGTNPLAIYIASEMVGPLLGSFCTSGAARPHCDENNTFHHYVDNALKATAGGSGDWGTCIYALLNVALMLLLGWWMDRRGIVVKL